MDDKGLGFPDNIMGVFGMKRVMEPATIANDICRCMDENCDLAEVCARFVNRYRGSGRVVMSSSLWDTDELGMCKKFVDETERGERK